MKSLLYPLMCHLYRGTNSFRIAEPQVRLATIIIFIHIRHHLDDMRPYQELSSQMVAVPTRISEHAL